MKKNYIGHNLERHVLFRLLCHAKPPAGFCSNSKSKKNFANFANSQIYSQFYVTLRCPEQRCRGSFLARLSWCLSAVLVSQRCPSFSRTALSFDSTQAESGSHIPSVSESTQLDSALSMTEFNSD